MNAALGALVDRIGARWRDDAASGGPAAAMLADAAAALGALDAASARFRPPCALPVRAFLPAALDFAARGPLAAIAAAFAAVEPSSAWRRNPNYTRETAGDVFLARYGYVELVGPKGPLVSAAIRVGFLLLGPDTLYPDHAHPAVEAYHVVSGTAEWWDETDGWRPRPAGTIVFHPSGRRHATRTGKAPLLALYGWIGAIGVEAKLAAPAAKEERRSA